MAQPNSPLLEEFVEVSATADGMTTTTAPNQFLVQQLEPSETLQEENKDPLTKTTTQKDDLIATTKTAFKTCLSSIEAFQTNVQRSREIIKGLPFKASKASLEHEVQLNAKGIRRNVLRFQQDVKRLTTVVAQTGQWGFPEEKRGVETDEIAHPLFEMTALIQRAEKATTGKSRKEALQDILDFAEIRCGWLDSLASHSNCLDRGQFFSVMKDFIISCLQNEFDTALASLAGRCLQALYWEEDAS